MRYMGGKGRIAKHIVPILRAIRKQPYVDREGGTPIVQMYVEPFIGGASIFEQMDNPRLGSDLNPYLIALLKAVRDGWEPPADIDVAMYNMAKANQDKLPAHLIGFIGFGATFGAKWFGGYARGNDHKGNPRNYPDEMRRSLLKTAPLIQGAMLVSQPYDKLPIPPGSLIYCDPPYMGTTEYRDKDFDTYSFWQWADQKVDEGHTVLVSEYTPPPKAERRYWKTLWSGTVPDPMRNLKKAHGGSVEPKERPVERLFMRGLGHPSNNVSAMRLTKLLGKTMAQLDQEGWNQ